MPTMLTQLAERLGANLVGNGNVEVKGCAPINEAGAGDITFVANTKYIQFLSETKATAVICNPGMRCPDHLTRLEVDDPYYAFQNAMIELHGYRVHPKPMDNSARVHPTAKDADTAMLHPGCTVECGAVIGERTVLYPGVYVGPNASLGDDCIMYPNVVVYDETEIGDRVIAQSNAVIGNDGYGFATHAGRHHKIPQNGHVVIENDVEIGGGTVIQRAAMGETRIGEGTKIGDLVGVGHGVTTGKHCLIVTQVGISGSVTMGNYVVLAGQVGVTGHLTIGDGVQAAGKTAIVQDVPAGERVAGIPAQPLHQAKRNVLAATRLHELVKRVRELERTVEKLSDND